MADENLLRPPSVRHRLAELSRKPVNFDLAALNQAGPASGWEITDLRQPLPGESPGMPDQHGSWEIARRLMRGYEFADPSIVRAYYDPTVPLERRDMLLRLQALGLVHVFVGVRVGDVYAQTRELRGQRAYVWGWNYRTLEGHLEMGQMAWEVWKWFGTGDVEFRVHSVSRDARIANPLIWLGYRLVRAHEREVFLQSTKRRMRTFVEVALARNGRARPIRQAAADLTARRSAQSDAAHEQLARNSELQDR
jgi:uncharacterized protein (UPF0548 family)